MDGVVVHEVSGARTIQVGDHAELCIEVVTFLNAWRVVPLSVAESALAEKLERFATYVGAPVKLSAAIPVT